MQHSVIFRGAQVVASVEKSDPLHDEKVTRAVDDAHSLNKSEGASSEIVVKDQDDNGKIIETADASTALAAPQKKGK